MGDLTSEGSMPEMTPDSAETCALLERVRAGDARALDGLMERHRPELLDFVARHLDPRLCARIDPSDVVQEAQLKAVGRLDDYLRGPAMPFRLGVSPPTGAEGLFRSYSASTIRKVAKLLSESAGPAVRQRTRC